MKEEFIPWGNWYFNGMKKLSFPDDWNVELCGIEHRDALNERELIGKIDKPIGTKKLEEITKGRKSACIVIDDISRPTPGNEILPIILKKLLKSGMSADSITVLLALGAHRPMTLQDMEKKVGKYVLETVAVLNHNPFSDDLIEISAEEDQVIKINRVFMEADLKILVGCIVPHTLAGFSGGAKNIIPGIGGIETLESNHKLTFADLSKSRGYKTCAGNPENPVRRNMEQIGGICGVDFIINVVFNDKMKVINAFAGHYIKAHREACQFAKQAYKTKLIPDADIVILNAYPKDTEYCQIGTAFSVFGQNKAKCFNEKSTLILATAATEGAGHHALFGPGGRLFTPHDDNTPPEEIKHVKTYLFSTGVNSIQIRQFYNNNCIPVFNNWNDILKIIMDRYKKAKVAIYPLATIQIGYMEE